MRSPVATAAGLSLRRLNQREHGIGVSHRLLVVSRARAMPHRAGAAIVRRQRRPLRLELVQHDGEIARAGVQRGPRMAHVRPIGTDIASGLRMHLAGPNGVAAVADGAGIEVRLVRHERAEQLRPHAVPRRRRRDHRLELWRWLHRTNLRAAGCDVYGRRGKAIPPTPTRQPMRSNMKRTSAIATIAHRTMLRAATIVLPTTPRLERTSGSTSLVSATTAPRTISQIRICSSQPRVKHAMAASAIPRVVNAGGRRYGAIGPCLSMNEKPRWPGALRNAGPGTSARRRNRADGERLFRKRQRSAKIGQPRWRKP